MAFVWLIHRYTISHMAEPLYQPYVVHENSNINVVAFFLPHHIHVITQPGSRVGFTCQRPTSDSVVVRCNANRHEREAGLRRWNMLTTRQTQPECNVRKSFNGSEREDDECILGAIYRILIL